MVLVSLFINILNILIYFSNIFYEGKAGQNIGWEGRSDEKPDWDGMIQSFYDEVKDFKPSDIKKYISNDDTGHFTQVHFFLITFTPIPVLTVTIWHRLNSVSHKSLENCTYS